MLVFFQFKRFGCYANGLVKADSLDKAGKALWNEPVETFKWDKHTHDVPKNTNYLTVEEYKYERSSDGKTEPEDETGNPVGK